MRKKNKRQNTKDPWKKQTDSEYRGYFTAISENEIPVSVKKDGKECPCVVLRGPKTIRLAGLGLIAADLEFCISGIELMLELNQSKATNRDNFIIRSILFSTVITYGKIYTSAEERKVKRV